ncbi:MAG: glycoside hydrolase [Elusimicrobiota bacterium]|nr:MAG: glycoside hydrolase [Elusimicrobiota bacterium]
MLRFSPVAALAAALIAGSAAAATGGLDVAADGGRLHRLESPSGPNVALNYRRSDDGGKTWTAPVRVDGGRPAYHFGAGEARVAGDGSRVFALWARPGRGPHGSGPLAVAVSTDGGKTWTAGASPAGAGSVGRRFPALVAADGAVHAFWLDRASNAKLLASRSTDGAKSWSKPVVVDEDVCECCWNAALAADGAVWVLYRDKDPRDMGAAVSRDGGRTWSKPARPGAFGWGFDGCPHVGGALAPAKGGVAALVWTGKSEDAGLYVFETANGADWKRAARLGGAGAKHADMATSGTKQAVVWDEEGKFTARRATPGVSRGFSPRRAAIRGSPPSKAASASSGAGKRGRERRRSRELQNVATSVPDVEVANSWNFSHSSVVYRVWDAEHGFTFTMPFITPTRGALIGKIYSETPAIGFSF